MNIKDLNISVVSHDGEVIDKLILSKDLFSINYLENMLSKYNFIWNIKDLTKEIEKQNKSIIILQIDEDDKIWRVSYEFLDFMCDESSSEYKEEMQSYDSAYTRLLLKNRRIYQDILSKKININKEIAINIEDIDWL